MNRALFDNIELQYSFENLCSNAIQPKIEEIVNKTIEEIQSYDENSGTMLTDGYGFKNVWDEICFQEQTERSVYWFAYHGFLMQIVKNVLEKKCSKEERIMIWMTSQEYEDEYGNLSEYFSNYEESMVSHEYGNALYELFDFNVAINIIIDAVLAEACDYSNERIVDAIEGGAVRFNGREPRVSPSTLLNNYLKQIPEEEVRKRIEEADRANEDSPFNKLWVD